MSMNHIELMLKIKDFRSTEPYFMAAIKAASSNNKNDFTLKHKEDIDNSVLEEIILNLIIDKIYKIYTKKLSSKEKLIFNFAYNEYRKSLITKINLDISIYDEAYQEIINIYLQD